ncbi:MAG TPA: Uma2 family endonuclease [Saprospiraceae bacterium]|nr:Uma2 family endonuclease [Saprospiraceae bacterium]
MDVAMSFPLTLKELADMAPGEEIVRFPATFDEYWRLLEKAEYRADFYQNEIIAMSYESEIHSDLVTHLSYLLKSIYIHDKSVKVRGSNRPVCIPDCKYAVFNPDGSLIQMPGKVYEYQPGMTAELTPVLLFEVLSPSTRGRDLSEKLPCYKKIPTLRHIVFIESFTMEVTVWERLDSPGKWLEETFTAPESGFVLGEKKITLREIYEVTAI